MSALEEQQGGNILVVDDDPTSRRSLARILTAHAYKVSEAESGKAALNALGRESFDVVVLDLMMPGMSGIEVCQIIRKNPQFGRVPVVLVTAHDEREFKIQGKQAGAEDFLVKPVDEIELTVRIRNLVLLRRYYQHLEKERASLLQTVEEQSTLIGKAMSEIGKAKQTLRRFNEEIIFRLSKAIEFRDDETGNHVQRMSRYCGLIASELGMSNEMSDAIRVASALHDVGKISISDEILKKPGMLTKEEMAVMRKHAERGYRILSGSESNLLELAATIARSHHERFDGTGYPQRIQGEDIPLEGRIAAVADVFDALTSNRVYKSAFSVEEAVKIIKKESGTGFDPAIVDIFLKSQDNIKNIMIVYADR
jgi:putative two-component system response regulator